MNTPESKGCVKNLARSKNTSKSMAVRVLKNEKSRTWLLKGMRRIVKYELKKLCSSKFNSLLRSNDKEHISHFPWDELLKEFSSQCPVLMSFLTAATDSQSTHQNRNYIVCMIVCILGKYRCSKMCLFQKMISALLFSSHVGTSVYSKYIYKY